jgi:hypothetical protein
MSLLASAKFATVALSFTGLSSFAPPQPATLVKSRATAKRIHISHPLVVSPTNENFRSPFRDVSALSCYGQAMAKNESRREEFERMRARHQREIERLREGLSEERLAMEASRLALLDELEAARREWDLATWGGPYAEMDFLRHFAERFGGLSGLGSRKRRPRDEDGGVEPAPVKPRPNPTPLAGAAEAPIE